MRRFFRRLWVITALAHVVVFGALHTAFTRLGIPFAPFVALGIAIVLLALFRGRLEIARHDRPISRRHRVFDLLYFAHWCAASAALVLAAAGVVGLVVTVVVARLFGRDLPWIAGEVALGAYGVGLVLSLYGVLVRARRPRVRTLEIPIRGLDPSFDGYRVVQLSDLHIGSLFSEVARGWVRTANGLAPDLVALTGDYVTNGVEFHEEIAAILGELRAKDAVIAILGNHDYFGGAEPLATLLGEGGVTLLRNARRTIPRGEASIEVAGVDDTWTRNADMERTLRGFDGSRPLLGLTHDPSLFPDFARRGAALVLAGHTHWGQVGLPFVAARKNLATRIFRFSAGLYREGDSVLYVSPGLGTTGPPIRLGSAPEITLFVLRCA